MSLPPASSAAPNSAPRFFSDDHPEWTELAAFAWQMAETKINHTPGNGVPPILTCMPNAPTIWLWDSCFMVFYARYAPDLLPALNNLDFFYRLQREDGFIAMAHHLETAKPKWGERINPPLAAWAELAYWRLSGDASRFPRVLPALVRFFDWVKHHRRRTSGLYWFEDSGSSGMDNSPRSGYHAAHLDGSDICHIDLIAQQALAAEALAEMAHTVEDEALAARMGAEREELVLLLNRHHWSERGRFYYDLFHLTSPGAQHNFVNHETAAAFWPLLAGACNEAQVAALLERLQDPEAFWTRHPVATLSRRDPNFTPSGGYWLGGVWPPINYMVAKGAHRVGRPDVARKLAEAHLDAMATVFRETGTIWEAYAPDAIAPGTKKRLRNPEGGLEAEQLVRRDFVGWGGLGPMAMLAEDVFGLDFDAPAGRIRWRLELAGRHGVEDVRFGGGRVSLVAERRVDADGLRRIKINSDVAFTLELPDTAEGWRAIPISPGSQEVS